MTEETTRVSYQFGAIPTSLWQSLDPLRGGVFMISMLITIVSVMSHALPLAIIVSVLGTGLVFIRIANKPLIGWVMPIGSYLTTSTKGRNPIPAASIALHEKHLSERQTNKPRKRINKARWPMPINHPDVKDVQLRSGMAGAWCRGKGKGMLMTICWDAELRQPFVLMDESDQVRFLSSWGQVLGATCSDGSTISCVSVMQRQVPDVKDDDKLWMEQHISDNVDQAILRDYIAMREQIGSAAAASEIVVGLTCMVKNPKDLDPLILDAEEFQRQMESAGFSMSILSGADIAELLFAELQGEARGKSKNRLPAEVGPLAWNDHWSTLDLDGRTHRSYVVTDWPRVLVTPTFIEPLVGAVAPKAIQTITFHFFPVSARVAQQKAKAAVTAAEVGINRKAEKQIVITSKDRQIHDVATRRERALAEGHAEHRLVAVCSVSVEQGDTKTLERAQKSLKFAAAKANIVIQPAWGEQASALAASLPFGMASTPKGLMG